LGGRDNGRWYEGHANVDFSDVMGIVENLVDAFNLPQVLTREAAVIPGFNPHATAVLSSGNIGIGVVGQLHPQLIHHWELDIPVFAAEISLDALFRLGEREIRYQPLPKFPGTRRDLAVVVSRDVPAEKLRLFLVQEAGGKLGPTLVENVRLFDVYNGKPIPDTHVSLAFAIEYRSSERTLTDAEIAEAFEQVQHKLKTTFDLEIRN
jgi:phenylalanyl-tRNA synthetase beta chain